MPPPPRPPIVVIPCDRRMVGKHMFHMVGEKYIEAIAGAQARGGAGAVPLLVPVIEPALAIEDVFALADGVLFTGSPSNVHPRLYGGPGPRSGTMLDTHRDGTTLALIRACIDEGLPMLAICRGFQELNVALGGTLHQHVHEVPGRFDHRDSGGPVEEQYAPAHTVAVMPGSLLAEWTGAAAIEVNSLHSQGIDRLAAGLAVEAVAGDGTIEAVRVESAQAFAYGVQWHPEWKYFDNPASCALFRAFGEAVRLKHVQKHTSTG